MTGKICRGLQATAWTLVFTLSEMELQEGSKQGVGDVT